MVELLELEDGKRRRISTCKYALQEVDSLEKLEESKMCENVSLPIY